MKLWNPNTGKELKTLEGHSDSVMSIVFSRDGQILASVSFGDLNDIRLWDITTGKEVPHLKGHSWACTLKFSPEGRILASGSLDQTFKLWDTRTGEQLHSWAQYGLFRSRWFYCALAERPDNSLKSRSIQSNIGTLRRVKSFRHSQVLQVWLGSSLMMASMTLALNSQWQMGGLLWGTKSW